MAYIKDIDLNKLLSTILEYTVDSTPTDTPTITPTCACKAEGGFCGDDTSTCDPKPDGTYDIASCTCPNGNMIFCPKCPDPCTCADEGGSCGDDVMSECPDDFTFVNCSEAGCVGVICAACYPTVPPTPSTPICNCLDCGLWPYERDSSCWEESCNCSYGTSNGACWNCPSTDTPTTTNSCDGSTYDCFCDTGSRCEFCIPGVEECQNRDLKTCDNGCIIECGDCVPIETPSPSPSTTITTDDCPCDCADFNSMADCEDFRRRFAVGQWHCSQVTCYNQNGNCFPNSNCADLIQGPPTPTPPPTTPSSNCRSRGCYNPGSNCQGCTKNGGDYCLNCTNGLCSAVGQPAISCQICIHVPIECKNGKYSTQEDCETALQNDPEGSTGKVCDRCDIAHICTDGTPNQEECYCIFALPTNTPTPSTCYCREYGYSNVGTCGRAGVCNRWTFVCPRDQTDIVCDECCTPSPTVTCACGDQVGGGSALSYCFSTQDNCDSYADTIESLTGQECTCSGRDFPCGNTSITCYCAFCRSISQTPSPSPTYPTTPSCPPGCCRTESAARALTSGKCLDTSCCTVDTFQTRQAPPCDCYGARLSGSADTNKPCGNVIGPNCYFRGNKCTSSVNPICYHNGSAIFAVERGRGSNDGDYTNCG